MRSGKRRIFVTTTTFLLAGAAGLSSGAGADSPEGPPIIFFDSNSVRIEPPARLILDRVAASFGKIMATGMTIKANADRAGSDPYNRALSLKRAQVVRHYLVSRGVPAAAVGIEAQGETVPLVATADGVREAQNRYALISYTVE